MLGRQIRWARRSIVPVLLMFVCSIVLLLNGLSIQSPIIGAIGSFAYFFCGGYLIAEVLQGKRNWVTASVGAFFLIVPVTLIGWFFTAFYKLGMVEVFVSLCATALLVLLARRLLGRHLASMKHSEGQKNEGVPPFVRLLGGLYIVLAVVQILFLLESRTAIPTTVWDTMNPYVMPVLFFSILVLATILFSKEKWQVKLLLVIAQSILAHMFFVSIFESGYGLDQWVTLGSSRRLFDESDYPRFVLFSFYGSHPTRSLPLIYRIYKPVTTAFLPALETALSRMFSVDVYWGHLLLVPVLWGVFIPLIAYRLTEIVTKRLELAQLSALLTLAIPSLILWGAVSVGNSVGFLLFFLTILLLADYLSSDRRLLWAVLSTSATLMTHLMTGVMAFSLLVSAYLFKKYLGTKSRRLRTYFLPCIFLVGVSLLPFALYAGRVAYPALTGSDFSLKPLQGLSSFDAVMMFLLGAYAEYSVKEALVHFLLPLLGFFGLIYVNTAGDRSVPNKGLSQFLLLAFVFIMVDYRIIKCFMVNVPFGEERIWVLRDMLSVPFASILLYKAAIILSKWGSWSTITMKKYLSVFQTSDFGSSVSKAVAVICISALITSSVYLAYPHTDRPAEYAWPTAYEIEAATFIDAYANEPYVVISYERFKLAGYAVVGITNPKAYYSMPYDLGWTDRLFHQISGGFSATGMIEAAEVSSALIGYYVTSKVRVDDAADAIEILSEREDFELIGVFGNDDIYVYKYDIPSPQFIEGIGTSVYLLSHDKYVNVTYRLNIATYDIEYTLKLVGSSNYSLTEWPLLWSFESIGPEPDTRSIDGNHWINFTGDAGVEYTVAWAANILYEDVGWKDDSFVTEWIPRSPGGFEESPVVTYDGDILTVSANFSLGVREHYWIRKPMNISTDLYRYAIVRWRSTSTCAISWVYYEDGTGEPILTYGSYSQSWTTTAVKLAKEKTINYIMVGLDDFGADIRGEQLVQFDFIMLANM